MLEERNPSSQSQTRPSARVARAICSSLNTRVFVVVSLRYPDPPTRRKGKKCNNEIERKQIGNLVLRLEVLMIAIRRLSDIEAGTNNHKKVL